MKWIVNYKNAMDVTWVDLDGYTLDLVMGAANVRNVEEWQQLGCMRVPPMKTKSGKEIVGWVVRQGNEPGKGFYLTGALPAGWGVRSEAFVFRVLPGHTAIQHGGRVVPIVRKVPACVWADDNAAVPPWVCVAYNSAVMEKAAAEKERDRAQVEHDTEVAALETALAQKDAILARIRDEISRGGRP